MMIFDYIFLSYHFDRFAYQSEWVSAVYLQNRTNTNSNIYMNYLDCRGSMADKMMTFNHETKTFFGWFKSFIPTIPTTPVFKARKQLGGQLQTAHNLFLKLSIDYLKRDREKKMAPEKFEHRHENKHENVIKPVVWKKPIVTLEPSDTHLSERGMWSPIRRF